jgi:hypothetical protein
MLFKKKLLNNESMLFYFIEKKDACIKVCFMQASLTNWNKMINPTLPITHTSNTPTLHTSYFCENEHLSVHIPCQKTSDHSSAHPYKTLFAGVFSDILIG